MKTYITIMFGGSDIPGGSAAILEPCQCGKGVAKIFGHDFVWLDLEEHDERVGKVLALLTEAGKETKHFRYWTEYTEEERQAAPLLNIHGWDHVKAWTGPQYGVTYDMSQACPTCVTGLRQTSPLIVDGNELREVEKHRVSSTYYDDLLVRDTDVEKLVAANVTGALFWPVTAKRESGAMTELRWQQAVIDHVLPPMAPSTLLDRESECSTCHRGRESFGGGRTLRFTYRREDLKDICDFNVSWEWFGPIGVYGTVELEGSDVSYRRPKPLVLVTPKVMNLIRGKTKKEAKYQGCGFTPVWIEDEKHEQPYLQT